MCLSCGFAVKESENSLLVVANLSAVHNKRIDRCKSLNHLSTSRDWEYADQHCYILEMIGLGVSCTLEKSTDPDMGHCLKHHPLLLLMIKDGHPCKFPAVLHDCLPSRLF